MIFNDMAARLKLEHEEGWRTWVNKIPVIQFDPDWQVKVIPPVGGAMVRFFILKGNKQASIYLDCYDVLGCVGHPYWEVYPVADDVGRCDIDDIEQLLVLIRRALEDE